MEELNNQKWFLAWDAPDGRECMVQGDGNYYDAVKWADAKLQPGVQCFISVVGDDSLDTYGYSVKEGK
jgi:hypothetical protein